MIHPIVASRNYPRSIMMRSKRLESLSVSVNLRSKGITNNRRCIPWDRSPSDGMFASSAWSELERSSGLCWFDYNCNIVTNWWQ